MKVCTKCGENKPLDEFYKDAKRVDGHQVWCKPCLAAYRIDNREKLNAKSREYAAERSQDPEYKKRRRAYQMHYRFGITLAEYDEMLEVQSNGCAICGKTPEKNGQRLSVDHNHETGEIRGLLCFMCNRGIGLFHDNPDLLHSAAAFLEDRK